MPTILGANTASSGDLITNSLRFNDDDTPKLARTPSGAGNRRTWTWSGWIKRSSFGTQQTFFSGRVSSNDNYQTSLAFRSDNNLLIQSWDGAESTDIRTTALYRDPSAWYHVVIAFDTTQSTNTNRVKVYVNGSQETAFDSTTYPDQNDDTNINAADVHNIGQYPNNGQTLDGYLAEVNFIDGQQLAPTQFGETNSNGVWVPKEYDGSYGTNGFYLQFKETGTSANSSGIGADTSGNDHHWTPTNLAATDITTDTPMNNFATFNPLIASLTASGNATAVTLSEGNCKSVTANSGKAGGSSTIQMSSGKWYAEFEYDATNKSDPSSGVCSVIGVTDSPQLNANSFGKVGERANDVAFTDKGTKMINDSLTSYGNAYSTGDIIGVAVDLDNNKIYFSINGTFQNSGDPTSGATGTGAIALTAPASTVEGGYYFAVGDSHTETTTHLANFGASYPAAISSGNSDGAGFGNFEYAVPSGYYALNTKNLAEYG